jgi:hypothetical protein
LCNCRNAAACTCVPDPRVPDTILYRRDEKYDAETIKGCASMFAYRFLPNRAYIVHIRQFACETCANCLPARGNTHTSIHPSIHPSTHQHAQSLTH